MGFYLFFYLSQRVIYIDLGMGGVPLVQGFSGGLWDAGWACRGGLSGHIWVFLHVSTQWYLLYLSAIIVFVCVYLSIEGSKYYQRRCGSLLGH